MGGRGGGHSAALFPFLPPKIPAIIRAWGTSHTAHNFITGRAGCSVFVTVILPPEMGPGLSALMRGTLGVILEGDAFVFRYLSATGQYLHAYFAVITGNQFRVSDTLSLTLTGPGNH